MSGVTVPFFISHQGCPQTCVFCDQRAISGSNGYLPTGEEIVAKVLEWHRSADGRRLEVAFFGGTFTALSRDVQARMLYPLQSFLASGMVMSIRISTRPDCIDREIVRWLAAMGVGIIELGVQSMDDSVLWAAGRGHTAAASRAAIGCITSCGLSAGAQLMPGLPGDTLDTSLSSLRQVIDAGADFVRLYPAIVFRGTELADRYERGEYLPLTVDDGVALCKVLLQTAMRAEVDVIRIGLQATEGVSKESVLAGCWHPALGQLVRSELFYDLMVCLVSGLPINEPLTVRCHPSRISDVIGHGRKNMVRLAELGVVVESIIKDNSVSEQDVVIEYCNKYIQADIVSACLY